MGFLPFLSGGGASLVPATAVDPAAAMSWADPNTWHSRPPGPRDVVRVPAGRVVIIDQDLEVAALEVEGEVRFAERNLRVACHGILVSGAGVLRAGSAEQPFGHRLNFVLGGSPERELIDGLGSKFLAAINGGRIELNGPRTSGWLLLDDSAAPGTIVLRLPQPVDWHEGDRIVIASGGAELPLSEERTIFAIAADGRHLSLDAPLRHRHHGQNGRVRNARCAIARVARLSRPIVVEGDASALVNSLGAHCMIAGRAPGEPFAEPARGSVGSFVGVEFRRMGQFNRSGRYPLYWHANGDAAGSQLVDCVIHSSFQRGVVVSESRGVKIHGNVVHKPLGHGFIVDQADRAIDMATMISSNLTIRPHAVRFADPAMRELCERRPRSLWISDKRLPAGDEGPA